MITSARLLTRKQFRDEVFARDSGRCVVCGRTADDAHHIIERRLWPDGGYYLDNGASVCEPCHLKCEQTIISVEEIRRLCGITRVVVPPHLYPDHIYDKWGNPVLADGRRLKGELFDDPSVQKVLRSAGMLERFTHYVKYPRTHHLPWSPGIHDDDRVIESLEGFRGREVVVTEKMDGENTSMYSDHIHARSVDARHHPSRDWVKNFWSQISHDIPTGWRICGENLYAEHSISYNALPDFFLGFSVWDADNVCLSWDETLTWLQLLGITSVPVLYRGPFDEEAIRRFDGRDWDRHEGYIVRITDAFPYGSFRRSVAKWVRPGHIQTTKHWMQGRGVTPNALKSSG